MYSTSNRSEYQKIFLGVKRNRRVRLTTKPPSVRRFFTKCGILDISQPYRPWVAFLLFIQEKKKDTGSSSDREWRSKKCVCVFFFSGDKLTNKTWSEVRSVFFSYSEKDSDHLCGLVVRVLGYRSGGPGSIPGTTRKRSSVSGTGSTQPREYNWGATW
jgi:hypothetical protein